ncbi:Ig-like domain-containing alpha-2-macroglobulin family protein [Hyalangium gracile]|uniref:Ig-like domain-containing alpha-2-macroglobulin family protein n=1 Tax=Hyalangium gracile TaxID=394092 RepID=UPI001CCA47FB|nr:Ig-like domain-containing alpha-2-macroglobulin family protein [Hyalangium gracile]
MGPQSVVTPSRLRSTRARWWGAALLVATTLVACKEDKAGPPPAPPSAGAPAPGSTSPGSAQAPQASEAPVTPESLSPVIKELGAEGVVPDKVVFEFSRNVQYSDGEGKKGTVVRFSPDVGGYLEYFRNSSALSFTPGNGFDLGTTYTVTLDSVETPSGVVKAPSEGAWTHTFTTPKLAFLRMAPAQVDTVKGLVVAELMFSGPVDASAVQRYASFQVDGKPISDVKLTSHATQRYVIVAQLTSPQLRPGATVRLALKAGLVSPKGGGKAPAAEDSFELRGGKRMDITSVTVAEGNTGFYLEVSCRDVEMNAPPSPDEGEWDPYYYDNDNLGCVVDDTVAADAIHFTPPVKFSISPSRRGFRIFGDYKRGTYTLKIDAGLLSAGGGRLLSTYQNRYSISARKSQLAFTSAGRYLPRSAWRNLPLNYLNVDTAELTIRHVPPENLVFWMSDDEREATDERTSNVLVSKKLPLKPAEDTLSTTYLDVGSMVPSTTRGVVEVSVKRDDAQAAARILLTDLSLVAKRGGSSAGNGQQEVSVWVLGMESTEPLSGVEVSLVKKSGQSVARCTTSGADGCKLQVPAQTVDTAAPFALIARKGEDLTYLKYSELKTEIANSDVQGEPYRAQAPYRASIYSDRGVYRPGDTAHVAAILRDQEDKAPPAGMPVELRVIDPREREFKKVALKTNEAGLVSLDLPFEAFQDTGSYRVALRVADREVATYGLQVEEFVPERMKVTASVDKAGYQQGSVVPVKVEAAYLFGGSAEGSPVELNCRLEPSEFKPKENAQFTYGVWRQKATEAKAVTLGQVKGEMSDKGQALVECPAKETAGGFKGPARLVAQASVFEAGSGRSTVGDVTVPMHPEAYYVGLQSGVQKVNAGKPFTVTGVVVDWEGRLVTDAKALKPLEVEYLRLEEEYGYYYDESEGYERYQRYVRPVREGRSTTKVEGGKFQLQVTPSQDAAGFIVRVRSGNAQTDLHLEGNGRYYWYGDGEARVDQTPRPLKPASIALELPKAGRLNEPIAVKFKVPYRGRVLLTAETDQVIASEWKAVEPGEVSWTFTPRSFAPNVYVAAFLVKDPHLESAEAFMPDRAFGVGSVTLEPTDFTQTVKLDVPKEVRSNSTLTVNLELGPQEGPTFATVAVVDEGILSLTRFKSPDPLKELFAKRALGVETFETIGWTLLVPPGGNSRSTGGDEEGAAGRVQPVKPVALWSGVVSVPASGKLSLPFNLPMYRGAVRVMAVTTGPKRVGRADAQVLVRDPLVLQTTLPRFLTQGDEIQIPVFLTNLSGSAQEVKVSLTAENLPVPGLAMPASVGSPLQMLGKSEGRTRLENGKAATLVFQAKAITAVGAARLKVTAEGGGFTAFEQLDVPLHPAGARERTVQRIPLESGRVDLAQYLQGWVPTTESSTFWVTTNPYAESLQHLSYLVRYPYGCIEQTTSSTRPLLFVSQLIDNVDPTLTGNKKVEDMVMAGVNRLLSMQTPSGGFAYWPGQTEPVAWGTAYATHLLLDAQKLKYPVPQDRLDDAVAWLGQELNRKENNVRRDDHYGQSSEAYMHYVLSLSGKGRKARVQKLIDELGKQKAFSGEEREEEHLLKAALYLAGDRRYEKELKSPDLSPITEERRNSWSFYSDRRRRGLMLSTFQDLFGNDPAAEPLAQQVAQSLIGHHSSYYTTQELVWSITGLGKRVSGAASSFTPPTLVADGKEVAPQANEGGKTTRASDRTWALARASERKGLTLELKEKGEGKLYLIVNSEGVRSSGQAKTGGQGLTLSRTYRKLDGTAVSPGDSVNLADLLYVEIELKNTSGERIQNIALVDRLPAGWEIENARLGRGGAVQWVSTEELWTADYVNIRDDRMEVFGTLQSGESKKVVYAVRAVTAGKFTLPPVEAEAMYDPRIWARDAGQAVEVSGPWKDFLL